MFAQYTTFYEHRHITILFKMIPMQLKCLWDFSFHCFLCWSAIMQTQHKNWLLSLPSQLEPCMAWGEGELWCSHRAAPHEPSHWQTIKEKTWIQWKLHIKKYADFNIFAELHFRGMLRHWQAENYLVSVVLRGSFLTRISSTLLCQLKKLLRFEKS